MLPAARVEGGVLLARVNRIPNLYHMTLPLYRLCSFKELRIGVSYCFCPPRSVCSSVGDQSSQHSDVSLQRPENSTTPENVMSPPSTIPEDRPQSRSSSQSSVTSTRRKRRAPQEDPMNDALNRLENISSAINTQTEYDEFHYFGLNLAAQLRSSATV
ncbi:hypothetical protein EVAR_23928_1 [Eumeta japonica]|uniref:Uncharacterized protein n=1 Tax=Eumeta variegata TaxID=151549 RepID=A0A4C1V1X4_EUMVA|nr:hypothetical protein EVAR_23928_1 [Eumeta japonica]